MKIKRIVVGMLETNCYLLYNGKEMIVVDPGADAKKIIGEIEEIGINPKYIVNTHGHPDHVTANGEVEKKTGAKILENLQEGEKITVGGSDLRIMHTPGHTKDSVCLKGEGFLIGGDVLFVDGHGRTDLPGGSDMEMRETIQRLKKELPGETLIYPGHGEPFAIEDWKGDY